MENILIRLSNGEYWVVPKKVIYHGKTRKRIVRRRKAIELGDVTEQQIEGLRKSSGGVCSYCGGFGTHIDHIVPVSRDGKHTISNLTITCKPCNSSKGSRLLHEWAAFLFVRNFIAVHNLVGIQSWATS